MATQRVLTEEELNEQIRMTAKNEILAVLKGAVPISKTYEAAQISWKNINTELLIKQAMRNNLTRLLQMLTPKERTDAIKKCNLLRLPGSA